jgi:hypothetical protein
VSFPRRRESNKYFNTKGTEKHKGYFTRKLVSPLTLDLIGGTKGGTKGGSLTNMIYDLSWVKKFWNRKR